jgi:hypothetical protein
MVPSLVFYAAEPQFVCGDNGGVSLAPQPYGNFTAVSFEVGYVIESNEPLLSFRDELEQKIVNTALNGALKCTNKNVTLNCSECSPAFIVTYPGAAPCRSLVSNCSVLKTQFEVVLGKAIDPEVAEFLGYVLLQTEMDSGDFMAAIPQLNRIKYLSPLPLLSPITAPLENEVPMLVTRDDLSVSPWTIGAVFAMCKLCTVSVSNEE